MSKLEDYANKYRTIRRERRNGIFGSPARASAHRWNRRCRQRS